ncbi:hypothetical protein EVG20_g9337 [Dentipellis fragilis]|uniref:Uncharacterized protein n=1 Tax=Dentipellis fragilis TaxID=205917 RepID=A0A4Y9XYZ9_9AGAM|nr:hypothetical protein EVG20_g9337 [Dentipellis fragilis]
MFILTSISGDRDTGDPWRDATVSADNHTVASTPSQPIFVGDGFHCSDLKTSAAQVDPTIAKVQTAALGYMKTWLAEWRPAYHFKRDDFD